MRNGKENGAQFSVSYELDYAANATVLERYELKDENDKAHRKHAPQNDETFL